MPILRSLSCTDRVLFFPARRQQLRSPYLGAHDQESTNHIVFLIESSTEIPCLICNQNMALNEGKRKGAQEEDFETSVLNRLDEIYHVQNEVKSCQISMRRDIEALKDQAREKTSHGQLNDLRDSPEQLHFANSRIDRFQEELKQPKKVNYTHGILLLQR